jgi:hypothetical protein
LYVVIVGVTTKKKKYVMYPDVPSAVKPIPHGPGLPIPKPPDSSHTSSPSSPSSDVSDSESDASKESDANSKKPRPLTQAELNDLIRDLGLSKDSSQLLASRLNEHRLLSTETTYYWYRDREKEYRQFFTMDEEASLVYCNNVGGLIGALGVAYQSEEWRLFIDSSSRSLKAVLLHNGNTNACVPVGHSVQMSETYSNMELLLNSLDYKSHEWLICGDLKVETIFSYVYLFL